MWISFKLRIKIIKRPHCDSICAHDGMIKTIDLIPTNFFWPDITENLQKQIFHVYGIPEVIVSDNGSQFRANYFNAFVTSCGMHRKG